MTRRCGVLLGALSLASAPTGAHAYASAAGGRGLFDVRSADVPASGSVDVQISGAGYGATESNGIGRNDVKVVDGALQVDVGALGFGEVWGSFGAAMLSIDSAGYRAYSLRDGRVGAKVSTGRGRFVPGLAVETSLPWGNRPRGFSTGSADPAITALLTIRLPEPSSATSASLHLNAGWRRGGDERGRGFEGWPLYFLEPVYPATDRDRIDARAALELSGRRATLFAELLLDQIQNDNLAFSESPIFLTPGFRFALSRSLSILLASKITLASDDPATTRYKPAEDLYPNWQLGFAIAWSHRGADERGGGLGESSRRGPPEAESAPGPAGSAREAKSGAGPSAVVPGERAGSAVEPKATPAAPTTEGPNAPRTAGSSPQAEPATKIAAAAPVIPAPTSPPERLTRVAWEGAAVAPKPTSYFDLNQLAEAMRRDPAMSVEIRVVSDEPAAEVKGRLGLAALRAEYLKAFLVAAGVDPERVHASGVKADAAAQTVSAPVPRAEVVRTEAPAAPASPPAEPPH
ncbi:MAG: hypothetical protein U0167_02070 [bacterium]